MNYIQSMQQNVTELRERLIAKEQALMDMKQHLLGAKFRGFDPDGSRRDWIAVSDVLRMIETVREC